MDDEKKVPSEEVSEKEELKEEGTLITRRDFLVGAGAGAVVGVAAGAGVAGRRPSAPGAPPETVEVIKEVEKIVEVPGEVVEVPAEVLPPTMRAVTLNIDGKAYEVVVDVRESLWETMTNKLGLGSRTSLGCDRAQCGACGVLVDGRSVNGCTILSARLGRGQEIVTVNGITTGDGVEDLHPIQRAFMEEFGSQCAICSRGFVMSTYALLSQNLNPTEHDVRRALEGNICRCGNYTKVFDSVFAAAEAMRASA
ncbi:MAG: (2Fe-2S)-binding protein [Anaerolineae bacterium]